MNIIAKMIQKNKTFQGEKGDRGKRGRRGRPGKSVLAKGEFGSTGWPVSFLYIIRIYDNS